MATLDDRISHLEELRLPDEQPFIEGASLSVRVDPFKDLNFLDKLAYDFKWNNTITTIANFRNLVKKSEKIVNTLYTYRCCSKAIPPVKNGDDANKGDIYAKTFEVLEPEIQKIRDVIQYKDEAIDLFCEEVKSLTNKDKQTDVVPELLLWNMIKILDYFASIDAILNSKACIVTDFNLFKTAYTFLRPNEQKDELQKLTNFLTNQNAITQQLKTRIQTIERFDEVLIILTNMCASFIEEDKLHFPVDKHSVLRVIAYSLFLIDGNENIFRSKKLNLKRFSTLFKKYPVVPLYGDMQLRLETMIKSCPNYARNEAAWPISDNLDVRMAREYEIIHHLPTISRQHTEYVARFSSLINLIKLEKVEVGSMSRDLELEITNLLLEGLSLLGNWVGRVLQQSAWKYSKPYSENPNAPHAGGDISDENAYEYVVKKNYSKEECFALAEVIAFIKGLSRLLITENSLLAPHINACIYREIQELIQVHLKDMINHANKKNRPVKQDLVQLKNLAADNIDLFIEDSSKKGKVMENLSLKKRPTGPSLTQLELLRMLVHSLYAPRFNGKKAYSDKDLSKDAFKTLEDFYLRSYFYPFLMDYSSLIIKITDLGDLWYREFYLEKTKKIQFTIEQSLPWIVTDKILETQNKAMLEYVLYPLDIYNDAANRALTELEQQFLFDEIEAEINLCFDQLIFKLSDQLYATYKTLAASLLLDNPFRSHLEAIQNAPLYPSKSRFHIILKQRHFQLLGKSVDLNLLISQRINNYFRRNIDNAISRYEAKDICSIVELEILLNVIKLTHELLSKHLDTLDPYDSIFNEINGSSSLVSVHSRIIFHTIFELAYDFFPNFSYNSYTQRFVKAPILFTEDVHRDPLPKGSFAFLYGSKQLNQAFSTVIDTYSNFFGAPHLTALVNIIKVPNISLITDECLNNLGLKIDNILYPYVMELFAAMPPSSKLPRYDYLVPGCIGQFAGKLIDISQYPPLQSDVFQHFKEMGNTITFLLLLDHTIRQSNEARLILSAPFLGITPTTLYTPFGVECAPLYKATYATCNFLKEGNRALNPESIDDILIHAWKADTIYRPKAQSSSVFRASLDRIYSFISRVRPDWDVPTPEAGAVIAIDSTLEFYRLYSALLFIYCMPNADNYDNYDMFGDGLLWAGCTIVHCLQQKNRYLAFDFVNHVLNVNEALPHDPNDKKSSGFISNASRVKDLTDYIFSVLDFYNQYPGSHIFQIAPPTDDIDTAAQRVNVTLKQN